VAGLEHVQELLQVRRGREKGVAHRDQPGTVIGSMRYCEFREPKADSKSRRKRPQGNSATVGESSPRWPD
jgi:hypothetical protein